MLALILAIAVADPYDEVATVAQLEVSEVKAILADVEKDQTVLDRMAKPWEAKPWHVYREIFADRERLDAGLAFWAEHRAALDAAQEKYGVPPEIIVAILGVETRYGQVMGNDLVLTSLYTLGFFHSRRGPFFRKELGHFLRLHHDEGWPLDTTLGSYAGAMGMGQFIPSSYRKWAVDGNGDGKRDLFHDTDDAIASVANYFHVHGWRPGEPVLEAEQPLPAGEKHAKLYTFEQPDGDETLLGRHNFWVITRYNRSPLYARAVFDLSETLRKGRDQGSLGR